MSNPNQLSVIDRLQNTAMGRFVTANVAALGLLTATVAAAATHAALNAERGDAAETDLAAEYGTDYDLAQECIDEGMEPSKVMAAKMFGARKGGGGGWSVRVRLRTEALNPLCLDQLGINRHTNTRVLMGDGENPGRRINLDPWSSENDGLGLPYNGASYGGGPNFSNISWQHDHKFTKLNYTCTPGPEKTKVVFQQMKALTDANGDILAGPRIIGSPVKVYGEC